MALPINTTTCPQFAAAAVGQCARWPVVSKVNNLRPEIPVCRHNAAYIRHRRSQLWTPDRSLVWASARSQLFVSVS